jgi:hypothetical protein
VGCHRMSERSLLVARPPLGFVVEGQGEFNCYPSLVCRVVDASGFAIPIVNAGGYGNITRHFGDHLGHLALAYHPYHVIVTMDLKDALEAGLYESCESLRAHLEEQARDWLRRARQQPRLCPLPERIVAVIQVQKFESWMIADIGGLRESGYLAVDEDQPPDVDQQVTDPAAWLRGRTLGGLNPKNPRCAKQVISCLDPVIIRVNSRSFDKFRREVCASYGRWSDECGLS